jgi:heme exporter protein D
MLSAVAVSLIGGALVMLVGSYVVNKRRVAQDIKQVRWILD